jgi:hypothetical protein
MLVFNESMLTGNKVSMEIDVTNEQLQRWVGGELIQNAMPNLTADEREFIMTGITPLEWDKEMIRRG